MFVPSTSHFSGSLDAVVVHDLYDQPISHFKKHLVHAMITLNLLLFAYSDSNSGALVYLDHVW
jgi:hypothetical protein